MCYEKLLDVSAPAFKKLFPVDYAKAHLNSRSSDDLSNEGFVGFNGEGMNATKEDGKLLLSLGWIPDLSQELGKCPLCGKIMEIGDEGIEERICQPCVERPSPYQIVRVHRRGRNPSISAQWEKALRYGDKLYVQNGYRWWMLSNPSPDGGWRGLNVGQDDATNALISQYAAANR